MNWNKRYKKRLVFFFFFFFNLFKLWKTAKAVMNEGEAGRAGGRMGGRGGEGASWWRVVGKEKSWKAELFICAKIWLAVIKKAQRCSVYVCTSGRPKNWVGEGDTIKKKKKNFSVSIVIRTFDAVVQCYFVAVFIIVIGFTEPQHSVLVYPVFFLFLSLYCFIHTIFHSFHSVHSIIHEFFLKKKKEGKKRRGRFSIYK